MRVNQFRHLLSRHRLLATLILVAALSMKIAIPSGFMLGSENGSITVEICSGYGPMKMTMVMPGVEHRQDKPDHQGKEMPCAFSGLVAPAMTAVDPILLAISIAFILAIGTAFEVSPVTRVPAFLRPPLRGPPELP